MEKENKPNMPTGKSSVPQSSSGTPQGKPGTPAGKPGMAKPQQPAPKKKSKGIGTIIFLLILVLLLAVGGGLLLREFLEIQHEAEVAEKAKLEIAAQRDDLISQLDDLEEAFQKLSIEYSEMEGSLRAERATIRRLRAQLQRTGPQEPGEDVKERIEELEALLEEYKQKVERLKAENQELSGEKSQIQSSLNQATAYSSQLEREKGELEDLLKDAKILTISNIEATGIRERRRGDEPTDRARRTDKIQVCFTINKNLVAPAGNRDFYVRIIDPNNQVLTHFPDNTFMHEGDELSFTSTRTINFQNSAQDVCVIYDQDSRFDSGYYNIVIFSEGYELGYKIIELR